MKNLIDLIIPVYNGEKYIDNLLENLENQTFKDFRVIFVDDGSKDNSYKLLSEKLVDTKLDYLLLSQENKGAPAARNLGLKNVSAPWIAFMDCDDKILPEFLEYYYRAVTETGANLAMAGLTIVEENQKITITSSGELKYNVISPEEAMRCYTEEWIGVYCLLINSEIQRQYNLFEDEKCIYCEDAPYIAQVIAAAEKVAKIENKMYIYPTIVGSLSHSGSRKKFLSGINSFNRMIKEFEGRTEPACKTFLECGCARYFIAVLRKAAVQLDLNEFLKLTTDIPFKSHKNQVKMLKPKLKIASYLFLFSKRLFYYTMRLFFKS